jgi:hypothetical protein
MKLFKPDKKKKPVSLAKSQTNKKERVVKPINLAPPEFYKGSRFGYGWCDECGGNNNNVLINTTLTCSAGHNRVLLPHVEKEDIKGNTKIQGKVVSDSTPALFFV